MSIADELQKLEALRSSGAITEAEYDRAKALVLDGKSPGPLPGPTGARCIAVAHGPALVAVFPSERAVWRGAATAGEMKSLLGVGLAPAELMDVLVGVGGPRLRAYRASWGQAVPRRLEATLDDGSRLTAIVESADLEPDLPEAAFAEPESTGWRIVEAGEARLLLGIR